MAFENWLIFVQIMPNDSQKHLNNEWLPWEQNQEHLANFAFSESFVSAPTSLQISSL